MICVYKAHGPTDAHLVRHWLERNGIRAVIRGDLMGIRGEIPVGESWPAVWVDREDVARAEEAIRTFEGPRLVHPPWRCPRCGEVNEPNFGSCWSCQADRPDLPESQDLS